MDTVGELKVVESLALRQDPMSHQRKTSNPSTHHLYNKPEKLSKKQILAQRKLKRTY